MLFFLFASLALRLTPPPVVVTFAVDAPDLPVDLEAVAFLPSLVLSGIVELVARVEGDVVVLACLTGFITISGMPVRLCFRNPKVLVSCMRASLI